MVITKVDRLARSLLDLISIADDLRAQGVTLEVLTGTFNRDDPMGEAFFQMTGSSPSLSGTSSASVRMRALKQPVHAVASAGARPS